MLKTITENLKQAVEHLRSVSQTPILDAEILLAKTISKPRSYLYAHAEQRLNSAQQAQFNGFLQRRYQGEPIAYILQEREFWRHKFFVTKDVLIPRPESELLVELALGLLENYSKDENLQILELGTGSGAIALSLACERPDWQIIATDLSSKALGVAKKNAQDLKVNNVIFYEGEWFDALPNAKFAQQRFAAILSNPPYIAENDPCLNAANFNFEPEAALLAGQDGLSALTAIIRGARSRLDSNGLLMLEHGYDQAVAVRNLMQQSGFKNIKCYKDLAGNDRVSVGIAG